MKYAVPSHLAHVYTQTRVYDESAFTMLWNIVTFEAYDSDLLLDMYKKVVAFLRSNKSTYSNSSDVDEVIVYLENRIEQLGS